MHLRLVRGILWIESFEISLIVSVRNLEEFRVAKQWNRVICRGMIREVRKLECRDLTHLDTTLGLLVKMSNWNAACGLSMECFLLINWKLGYLRPWDIQIRVMVWNISCHDRTRLAHLRWWSQVAALLHLCWVLLRHDDHFRAAFIVLLRLATSLLLIASISITHSCRLNC